MAKKYLIIHGHFYQPPRENPWIEAIETQESAAPYHDWNERVYDECYRPNGYSRLLDAKGAIIDIHNNYRVMSFNFGPTLFSWLEQRHVATTRRIVDADASSAAALDGHGNALAQVFNHIIMPLASRRDQLTQIRWAKSYFRERFKRDPEGMWLAETAINMETVRCLVEENIRFVVLSPAQAEAVRPLDSNAHWTPAQNGLDIRRGACRVYPTDQSGNRCPGFLDVFFFDQALSREASFGDLLKDAQILGNRINAAFDKGAPADQVVVLATDGETFGHHKPFGDMCLAYFFKKIAPTLDIIPVNFGYFLAHNPPRYEVLLKNASGEGSAWSCTHGVGRWTRDCGCSTGGEPKWNQAWRAPLRSAIRKLQEHVDREFERLLAGEGVDPWALRDAYIQVFDDPSLPNFIKFVERHAGGIKLTKEKACAVRKLLEAQKYMLYAYTSCAWFFSDIGGLEAIQNIAYATRALQMGIGPDCAPQVFQEFSAGLEQAKSNVRGETGKTLFDRTTLPWCAHEKLLAFTAAVEKTVGLVRSDTIRLFHYDLSVRQLCEIDSGLLSYNGFDVAVTSDNTGEVSRWAVLVSHRERAEVRAWVVAAEVFGKKLTSSVEPETWIEHPQAQSLTLMDIFRTSRENVADYIHQNIFKDTYTKYSAWMQRNEKELDFLSRLNFQMPSYCLAPLSFVYQQQWNHLIRQLEHRGDEEEVTTKLRELAKMQEQYKILFDLTEGSAILERIIIVELSALGLKLSAETCARIEYLLNITDRFKLPVSKHKMEDIFAPIIMGPLKGLHDEVARLIGEKDAPPDVQRDLADKRTLLQALVNFARRMNFNTDAIKV